jgi:hypothetical protein
MDFGRASFALLGLAMAARLAAPFLPAESFSPSGFYCGSYYVFYQSSAFHTCTARAAFGEAARLANRADFVSPRKETFTVDPLGNRNASIPAHPRVVLSGSSFTLGLSLNDDETLAARLNNRLGPVVYSAANVLKPFISPGQAIDAAHVLGVQNGWVLLELVNRGPYGYQSQPQIPSTPLLRAAAPLRALERRMKDPYVLDRLSSAINMRVSNDVVLPNPNAWKYPEAELLNGRRMLFFHEDSRFFHNPPGEDETLASVGLMRDELAKNNLHLAVLLVPTGYTVYYPLIRSAHDPDNGAKYLRSLEADISSQGIPVFNALTLLRNAASTELTRGQLIYWPDDAHWNPQGVDIVAGALAPWLAHLIRQP